MKRIISSALQEWTRRNLEINFLSIHKIRSKSKNKRITIVFYLHGRSEHIIKIIREISKVKNIESLVYLSFIIDSKTNKKDLMNIKSMLSNSSMAFDIFLVEKYWQKVLLASHVKSMTIVKWDEDIYMSSYHAGNFFSVLMEETWDNFDVLSPIVSTGIPTCELFLDLYMDEESAHKVRQLFEKVKFEDWWDSRVQYNSLNGVYDAQNQRHFFQKVAQLSHPYKGMHPVRMSKAAQEMINEWILDNRGWIDWSAPSGIISLGDSPYFCNSIFSCSPKYLRTLALKVKKRELIFDGYDELALNELLNKKDRGIGFIGDSLAIHPSYNSIGESFEEISRRFFAEI